MGYEKDTVVRNVSTHYGPRTTEERLGGFSTRKGQVKEMSITFDYDDLPADATYAGFSAQLPANASIVSAKLEILTAFTSTSTTTDIDVGIADADGGATITDPNGLITVAEATQTTIGTAGNIITGAGALVGATIGAEAAVVTVTPNVADLLTGRGRVIVEYLPARA